MGVKQPSPVCCFHHHEAHRRALIPATSPFSLLWQINHSFFLPRLQISETTTKHTKTQSFLFHVGSVLFKKEEITVHTRSRILESATISQVLNLFASKISSHVWERDSLCERKRFGPHVGRVIQTVFLVCAWKARSFTWLALSVPTKRP